MAHPRRDPTKPRTCSKCGQTKPLDQFQKDSRFSDGYRNRCKACFNKWYSEYQKRNLPRVLEKNRKWAEGNRDKKRAQSKRSREKNPETTKAAIHRWQQANPEKMRAALKRWRQANPNKLRENAHNRRAAVGRASKEQIAAVVAYYGNRCYYCGGPFEHLDHYKPISAGGSNWPSNLRPSCKKCNLSKGDAYPWVPKE